MRSKRSRHNWPCTCRRYAFPHQTTLNTNWVSYNLIQFWHYLLEDIITSWRLRIQSYKTVLPPALQMPMASSGCHLCFWRTDYTSEVPRTLSLHLFNFLEQLKELRETVYLLDYCQFIIKWYNCPMEETDRVWQEEKAQSLYALSVLCHSPQISTCLLAQRLSEPHPLEVLWRLHWIDMTS